MPMIPTLREAEEMVASALKEKVVDAYDALQSAGVLADFSRQMGQAMRQEIDDLDDPGPVLRGTEQSPLIRMQRIREIRDQAVEQVLSEMLSTEWLNAEANKFIGPYVSNGPRTLLEVLLLDPGAKIIGAALPSRNK